MKSMKKALALGLALAMAVTAVPVTNAQAATAPKLSATKATIYVGGNSKLFTVSTPSTWKSVKVTAASSDTSVATVKTAAKRVRVSAVKAGTAKVTVKVTGTKSGKKVTKNLAANITVKSPAARIKIDGKSVKKPTVVVGSKTVLTGVSAPKSSPITFKSSDETIATVDADGTLTALKEGTVNIAATNALGAKYVINVTVKKIALQSVKQTKANTIEAVITGDTKSIKNADIVIANTDTKATYPVSALNIDANDATKVIITTFGSMTDGKTYTVTLDGVVKEFVATDNVVADVAVSPLQIVSGTTGTVIYGQTLDKNGVVLSESTITKNENNVTFTVSTTEGYVNNDELVLPRTGNKATAEITYHTYKYENGAETGAITKKFDIVAVDALPITISGFAYTLGTSAPADWTKVTPKTQVALGDTNMKAFFNFVDSNKKNVTAEYTVETSDNTTLLVGNETIGSGVSVTGLKEGSAYINVKKDGKFVTSLPVTVVPARKLNRVEIGTSSLTVSNAASIKTVETTLKTYDQYGDELKTGVSTNTEIISKPANSTAPVVTELTNGKISFDATSATTGSYQYRINVNGPANSRQIVGLSVNVVTTSIKDPSNATDLRLVMDNNIDIAAVTGAAITANIKVAAYEKGALLGYVDLKTVTFNGKADNVSVTSGGAVVTLTDLENGAYMPKYAAGTYGVRVETVAGKIFSGSITLKDSTEAAVITKRKSSEFTRTSDDAKVAAQEAITECLEINYKGQIIESLSGKVYVKEATMTGKSVYVKTAYIKVEIGGGAFAYVPVEVNQTFTAR